MCNDRHAVAVSKPPVPPFAFGASAIGPLHVQMGLPCQDAWHSDAACGTIAAAVADGLGSASHAEKGAQAAVRAAVQSVLSQVTPEVSTPELKTLVDGGMAAARAALEELAAANGWKLRDVACTLLLVVARQGRAVAGHIGDGAVVGLGAEGLVLLSSPGDSEYANEVTPLTSAEWQAGLVVSGEHSGLRSVALFTDGCQRAALRKAPGPIAPFPGFWNPLFRYAVEVSSLPEAGTDVERLLLSPKLCDNSEDDKTLVFLVLEQGSEAEVGGCTP